ncbi:hypothetical protein D9M70_553160 [compost metagenome]
MEHSVAVKQRSAGRGDPVCEIRLFEGDARQPLRRRNEHVLVAVEARKCGPGKPVADELGGVARAATEVEGDAFGQLGHLGEEISGWARAFVFELQILRRRPDHGEILQIPNCRLSREGKISAGP